MDVTKTRLYGDNTMAPGPDNAPEMEPNGPQPDPGMMDEAMPAEALAAHDLKPDPALEDQLLAEQQLAESATTDDTELDPDPAAMMSADEAPVSATMPEPADDDAATELRGWLDSDALAGIVTEVDPAVLEYHPLSELLPLMSTAEFAGHKDSIELDGQQVPAVLFEGRILDGRNRCKACIELGLLLRNLDDHPELLKALDELLARFGEE